MEIYATSVYVVSAEILKVLEVQDDPQAKMENAEVMTFAVVAAKFFHSNYVKARYFCRRLGLFPTILSNSRLNRRLHKIPWICWHALFRFLALLFKENSDNKMFAIDSFPIACCQKNRVDKRKLFLEKSYLGFAASKKRYFCGIKVHMLVTGDGKPIEVHVKAGTVSDVKVLWSMELDIPEEALLYADGAYNCFDLEDILQEEGIKLLAKRGAMGKNRLRSKELEREISSRRQIVETAFSSITNLLPRYLKVRTEKGFLLKVICTILAYSFSFICKTSLV